MLEHLSSEVENWGALISVEELGQHMLDGKSITLDVCTMGLVEELSSILSCWDTNVVQSLLKLVNSLILNVLWIFNKPFFEIFLKHFLALLSHLLWCLILNIGLEKVVDLSSFVVIWASANKSNTTDLA